MNELRRTRTARNGSRLIASSGMQQSEQMKARCWPYCSFKRSRLECTLRKGKDGD
jgi:hypothetical protein